MGILWDIGGVGYSHPLAMTPIRSAKCNFREGQGFSEPSNGPPMLSDQTSQKLFSPPPTRAGGPEYELPRLTWNVWAHLVPFWAYLQIHLPESSAVAQGNREIARREMRHTGDQKPGNSRCHYRLWLP